MKKNPSILPAMGKAGGQLLFLSAFAVIIFSFLSKNAYAQQETRVSFDLKEKTVKDFLNEIENQTNYTFTYSDTDIDVGQELTAAASMERVEDVFNRVLTPYKINYSIRGNQVLLTKANTGNRNIQPEFMVQGRVYSESDGMSLPGVNVVLQGTARGTVTDLNGAFSLMIPGEGGMLVFSFVGYERYYLPVDEARTHEIYLPEDISLIEGAVVVGYGRESRRLLSSSVSDLGSEVIEQAIVSDMSAAIQGRTTGVQVTQNSGTPGSAITVRVRGVSSINAGAEPLYVIDGVPMVTQNLGQIGFSGQGINTLSDLNPNDIESISILKDASATAIYGARGSNGVVLITTKRGKAGTSRIRFNSSFGYQQVVKTMDLLNARQFMEYRNEASLNDGGVPVFSEEQLNNIKHDTDWQSEIYRTAPLQSYDLSFSGGDEKTQYYISGSIFDQEGIVRGTDYSKISTRLNIDQQISHRIKVGANVSLSRSYNNRKEGDQSLNGVVPNAIAMPPIYPVYNDDGSYNDDGPLANPVNIADLHINDAFNWRTLGSGFAHIRLFEGLTYQFRYGVDYVNFREHSYNPSTTRQGARYKGLGLESTSEVLSSVMSNILNYYNSDFITNHSIEVLLGTDFESYERNSTYMRGQDFPNPELEYIASAAEIVTASASSRDSKLHSVFARAKYNFANKYIFTVSSRYDGSSRFGGNNRYGFFPSGDFAWRISQEEFVPLPNWFNEFKIRLSYGITGNDQIPDFGFMALFSTGNDYESQPGIAPSGLANPDLKWETTHQANIGIDLGFFNDRITLTTDFYRKHTKDLLFSRPIPPSTGFGTVLANIGEIENTGVELGLKTINFQRIVSWETSLNLTFNKNKVLSLYDDQPLDNIGRGSQRIEVGEPIGIFYGWHALGVDPATGDIVFDDVNGDGIIDANDRVKIGSPHPVFIGGVSNDFRYKNLSLNVFLNFSYGNDVFNGTRRYVEVMKGIDNMTTDVLDRWRQPGDVTQIPRATNADPNENDRASSRFIEDGSYLKIKSLRLAYAFPRSLTNRYNISMLQIYVQAQNLLTFTKYKGMDPEVNYAGQDVLRMGTDFFTYPHAKSLSVGINIEL